MRLHLVLALLTILLLVITLRANGVHHFTFAQVEKMAQARAAAPYVPMPNVLPPQMANLTPQQEAGIFWKAAYRLWRKKGLPFQVDFYHVNKTFPFAPKINTVDRKGSHVLAYSPSFFQFPPGLTFSPPLPNTLGYAGFYIRYPDMLQGSKPNSLDGFFTTQGSSYFRVLARDQVYGLSARGLAINSTAPGKHGEIGQAEEFPNFTQWWLHQPAPAATELVLDAMLDSPSVTGAYEFKLRPGDVTSVDVHASLYFRRDVAQLGVSPFSSMYLYGENAKNHFGDTTHPEIHDSDGLLIYTHGNEWTWRPLQQTPMQQLYNLPEDNPRGFGLLQRDRDFQHYQDLEAKYNVRPSAWVIPHGDWGHGKIVLFQLPTNNTNTDNVVLFWQPDGIIKAGEHRTLDYTIDFYMNDAQRPPLAYTRETFINNPAPPPPEEAAPSSPSSGSPPVLTPVADLEPPKPASPKPARTPKKPVKAKAPAPEQKPKKDPLRETTPVQFMVDFVGNGLENLPASATPDLDLTVEPPETIIREKKVEKVSYDNLWRVTFTIIPFQHFVPTQLTCRLLPHDSLRRLEDERVDILAQIYAAQQTNDVANETQLRDKALPQKEQEIEAAKGKALTETWTYTWHQ